ncbi:hypothetical protein [Microbispora sp. NPDC049633]|uniref:hypothetical protein n=1 Tax=Microbispora sp. NPDC049633 TaxID=3154355 RepID=UPI0034264AA6
MSSRYQDLGTESRSWRGKLVRGQELRPPRTWWFDYTDHTWREGTRIDLVAHQYYGDPYDWWQIADANPEIFWWGELEPGTIIRVPYV